MTLTNLSLFSGAGGLDLGARMVGGFKTVAYVEFDRYAQGVLMSRMRSGDLDDAPIFEDVRTFDGRRLRGYIDIVSGGFPCQDLSTAGTKSTGRRGIIEGTRSGLWIEYARIVREIQPRFVLVENVAGLLDGWMGLVLGDLAKMGYDAEWDLLRASSFGAPHRRSRVFIVAYPNRKLWQSMGEKQKVIGTRVDIKSLAPWRDPPSDILLSVGADFTNPECGVIRMDDGVETGIDRLRLTGNGVVSIHSVPAWQKIADIATAAK